MAKRGPNVFEGGGDFFCSNRGRRGGCGRTFSVLLADVLPRRQLRASTLSSFIQNVLRGLSRREAWREAGAPFTPRHARRVWQSIVERYDHIAETLCRLRPPPFCDHQEPLIQLFKHLLEVFPNNPIASFQLYFEQPFLENNLHGSFPRS